MKEITKPAYTILEQLDQQIDDSLQPGSMGGPYEKRRPDKEKLLRPGSMVERPTKTGTG